MIKNLKFQLLLTGLAAIAVLIAALWLVTQGYLIGAGAAIAAVCVYIVFLNIWLSRRVFEPIASLTDNARRIAEGSYGVQVELKTENEIGELMDEVNNMSQKIAVAEKNRTEFISQMSHELRTPLTAITGWAETIAFDPGLQEDSRRGIQIISKESERLMGMVSELLEFTRIQDGRFNLRVELIDVAAELEDAVFTYGELMRQAGIDISYTQPEAEIPLISGDPERLKQVFLNLLDNATKHGGDGKKVDVAIRNDANSVVISVRDFGRGIPENELPHIKEKFYKGSSKNRGTGIGLAVCDEIVTRHGGELTITNAEGGGVCAQIRLPLGNRS